MFDLLIVNGVCPDYKKGEMVRADIGIRDGKIVFIGQAHEPMKSAAGSIIDAGGKIVSPGFIDIHMHEENFAKEGTHYVISEKMLEMGVTTGVAGQCGNPRQTLKEFKAVLEENGGSPINYLMLTGYNTYRVKHGVGRYDQPTEEQKKLIHEDLKEDMEEGAYGLSFGIEYDPGMTLDEMLEAVYASCYSPEQMVTAHFRDDGPRAVDAVNEMIQISDNIQQKFQISHLSSCAAVGVMDECLSIINEAMDRNPKLDYDTYPYHAFSTRVGSAVFDEGCFEKWGKDYSDILLTNDPYKNVFCTEEIFKDARENHPQMFCVAFVMNEPEIEAAIVNEKGMIASDGVLQNGSGHPRAAGTFPRVLGRYVREKGSISMYDALRKMTVLPADRMGLTSKGRLEEGCDADITIFNPETICDQEDFLELKKPVGIDYVIMGGEIVLKDGDIVNGRRGRFIPFR